MKHVRKVVNANLKDIAFAANLKDALGQLGGVKGNLVKEIVLDRATELQVKKAALPGLKKMHHRVYSYSNSKQFMQLAVFENSFSSGKGQVYSSTKLENSCSFPRKTGCLNQGQYSYTMS